MIGSGPITGPIMQSSENVVGPLASARTYVDSPSFEPGAMDFYPRTGKCQGPALNLKQFKADSDFDRDFNGVPKTQGKRAVVFRGAYAGEGVNPGWRLQATIKPSSDKPSTEPAPSKTDAPKPN